VSGRVEQWLHRSERTPDRTVGERVAELLEAVRRGSTREPGESWDAANERHAEEFIVGLCARFPGRAFEVCWPPAHDQPEKMLLQSLAYAEGRRGGAGGSGGSGGTGESPPLDRERGFIPRERYDPVVLVERQRLRPLARRTTGYNYVFTVPGEARERLVLVAHYDTWRGPGADDNTTGEEILKQYLVEDLKAPKKPALTHVYILAGSEECGLIGFASQVVLGVSLGLANVALSQGLYAITALGLAMAPLAGFRFGVSGSREYVASLSAAELALVRSVIAVDSVGEGRMYIPETSLGASFVSAFFPYPGYEQLNHLLQEGAHLHSIKYNTFIAGGTTDHISFLEVGRGWRDRLGNLLGCPRWLRCHRQGKRRIPAAALVSLLPGKASPLVLGGKIHTPQDTADRVYPGPLGEALRIIDYWLHLMQGGARIVEPRELDEYHYAQLFRVRRPGNPAPADEHWLALKDAIEPNRRNLNGLYRVDLEMAEGIARCARPRIAAWGVDTRLDAELASQLPPGAMRQRLAVRHLELATADGVIAFEGRNRAAWHWLEAAVHDGLGALERFMGANTFLAFFGAAFLLAKAAEFGLAVGFRWSAFQEQFFRYFTLTLPLTIVLQLWAVIWLVGKKIPTMIDNAYRHLNKADNLRSLRRVRA
jgi:Peptidase family M28